MFSVLQAGGPDAPNLKHEYMREFDEDAHRGWLSRIIRLARTVAKVRHCSPHVDAVRDWRNVKICKIEGGTVGYQPAILLIESQNSRFLQTVIATPAVKTRQSSGVGDGHNNVRKGLAHDAARV